MAYIVLDTDKLRHNYDFLQDLFVRQGIEWGVVSKLLCGNRIFLAELIRLGVKELCDARISNLKRIKELAPEVRTVYIKPPALRIIPDVVRYADISFNTELKTLQRLSEEAVRQNKEHQVVIMIELGELREGVLRDTFLLLYEKAFLLPGIRIVGIGTHFSCISGVLPDREKLTRLVHFRKIIAERFDRQIDYVSGGSSVTIPLLIEGEVPPGTNHFRVGESLFFGTDVYHGGPLEGMYQDVLQLNAAIIELIKKPMLPDGTLGVNLEGNTPDFNADNAGKTSFRAIVDVGLLDVEYTHLTPADPAVHCIGASSDMLIVDLGENPSNYQTGDFIRFRLDYMAALRLMHSRYIRKRIAGR